MLDTGLLKVSSAEEIRRYLKDVIHRLKIRGVWRHLDPAIKGWLTLASKLESIKFRSREVLSVLVKILKRIKSLLSFPRLMTEIGVKYAWYAWRIASSWGNRGAERWKNDRAYQFYCGLTALQLSRIVPGMIHPELNAVKNVLSFRGFGRFVRSLGRVL